MGEDRGREEAVLGINVVGHPIATNGTMWRSYSLPRGGDAALPKLLWDFLLHLFSGFQHIQNAN